MYIYWNLNNLFLYIRDSIHRDSILIRSNKMQQYAGIYLLQNHSHISVVHRTHHQEYIKTVIEISGTGHSICATTFLQRGLWPLATLEEGCCTDTVTCTRGCSTDLCTPDVCDGHPKHVE